MSGGPNPEHLKILLKGVNAWNHWRAENAGLEPQLCNASLHGAGLGGINLNSANLYGADLSKADLRGACLVAAQLSGAKLHGGKLDEASLIGANLRGADLHDAYLGGAQIANADLSDADLSRAELAFAFLLSCSLERSKWHATRLNATMFCDLDLSGAVDLDTVRHFGPSTIGMDTFYRSRGRIPEKFLRDVGVPEDVITHLLPLIRSGDPIQWHSCFISYSSKDEEFAKRLHARMREANMRVWFAPEDLKGGQKLHEQLFEAIQIHDRLLLVLSEHSIKSNWVMSEIRKAREIERKENRRKLFPIGLIDYHKLGEWSCFDTDSGKDLAIELREYFIPDFSNWKDHDSFEKAFTRLRRDLQAAHASKSSANP